MRVEYKSPKKYDYHQPIIAEDGSLTERAISGLENALSAYVETSVHHAKTTDNNPANYCIDDIYIVGSGARRVANSDLDFLFIAPTLDKKSSDFIKCILAFIFFTDRPKYEAIDVYVRKEDEYPERANIKITNFVKGLLNKYNRILKNRARARPRTFSRH